MKTFGYTNKSGILGAAFAIIIVLGERYMKSFFTVFS